MLKKLWPYAKQYRGWILAGIVCSASEAVFELLIPLVMSDIVDVGIAVFFHNVFHQLVWCV